ncbi:MAG: holB [Acidobacteria bacterium]|nr:holB [Acidobacteriota bacterium]
MTTAASLLLETAQRDELHHAIIIHGPDAASLRDLSMRIAKTLNCTNGSTGDDCLSCQRIDRRVHPDIHHVEVGGEKKMISIEQIRDLLEGASMRPYEGRNKVFIIDPADALSPSGSNSLLKTLEEPTRDTTFILITRSPDLLLPTIRSRSQAIYVGDPRERDLAAPLETVRLHQLTAWIAEGDRDELASFAIDSLHRFAMRRDGAALLALAAAIAGRDEVKEAMALVAGILCNAVALEESHSVEPQKLTAIREAIPRDRLLAAADGLLGAIRVMTVNADARLVVEQAMAELVK